MGERFPSNLIFYTGMIVSLIFNYTFIKERFILASIAGNILLAFYLVLSIANSPEYRFLLHISAYSAIINFLGMFICYMIDFTDRKNYLLNIKLKKDKNKIQITNKELESIIRERTTELHEKKITLEKTVGILEEMIDKIIISLSKIVEESDKYTAGHQLRVAAIAVEIAKSMGMDTILLKDIKTAALLHDIGKIFIPHSILTKTGRLTEIEYKMIKEHPVRGYEVLKDIGFSDTVLKIIIQHHERENGSGYPNGLKSNDMIQASKIVAVADVVEAMSSHRPYRPALGIEEILEELEENKGILFDEEVVEKCTTLMKNKNKAIFLKDPLII